MTFKKKISSFGSVSPLYIFHVYNHMISKRKLRKKGKLFDDVVAVFWFPN